MPSVSKKPPARCSFSTGIHGGETCGYGDLDTNGFWEFDCPHRPRCDSPALASWHIVIDPTRITNFNRSDEELEYFAVFCILVAGKTARSMARLQYRLFSSLASLSLIRHQNQTRANVPVRELYECIGDASRHTPFSMIVDYATSNDHFMDLLQEVGVGCHRLKGIAIRRLAFLTEYPAYKPPSQHFLRTCTVDNLEAIHGIGPKTARFFLLHSRPNANVAVLDRHILRWLAQYTPVPDSTPVGANYKRLEQAFLNACIKAGKTPAELDLEIWNAATRGGRVDGVGDGGEGGVVLRGADAG